MKRLNKLSYVAERDLDLILLEELNVNEEFSIWLFLQAFPDRTDVPKGTGAWHSVTQFSLGESDLVMTYENGLAILIENKVDAPAQPDQAERYRKRGARGCEEDLWERFVTCIVAPDRYLSVNSEAQNYDFQLSYEQVRDWLAAQKTRRSLHKAYVFNEAIEQNRRGYSPIVDEDVTQFWWLYWELANAEYPMLKMPRPGSKPANSDWPTFRPPELGRKMNIVHKMGQGNVDLQVAGASEKLDQVRSIVKDPNFEVVSASKSAAIRIVVAPVDRFGSFDGQREEVVRALQAARKLLNVGNRISDSV